MISHFDFLFLLFLDTSEDHPIITSLSQLSANDTCNLNFKEEQRKEKQNLTKKSKFSKIRASVSVTKSEIQYMYIAFEEKNNNDYEVMI